MVEIKFCTHSLAFAPQKLFTTSIQGYQRAKCKLSPQGDILALTNESAGELWHLEPAEKILSLKLHPLPILDILFDPNQKYCVSFDTSTVHAYEISRGYHMGYRAEPNKTSIRWCEFQSDKNLLVINTNNEIYIMDLNNENIITIDLPSNIEGLFSKLSPNGQFLEVNSQNHKYQDVIDINNIKKPKELTSYKELSPNQKLFAVISCKGIHIKDTLSDTILFTINHPQKHFIKILINNKRRFAPYNMMLKVPVKRYISASFSNNSKMLIAETHDARSLWDVETGKELIPLRKQKSSPSRLSFWDTDAKEEIAHVKHSDIITKASYNKYDGKRLLTKSVNEIKIWDANNYQELLTIPNWFYSCKLSHKGNLLILKYPSLLNPKVFDLSTVEISSRKTTLHIPNIPQISDVSVEISPHENYLILTILSCDSTYQEATIYCLKNGQEVIKLRSDSEAVWNIDFSPDEKYVAFSSELGVKVYELATKSPFINLSHTAKMIFFGESGRWCACPEQGKMWDLATQSELFQNSDVRVDPLKCKEAAWSERYITTTDNESMSAWLLSPKLNFRQSLLVRTLQIIIKNRSQSVQVSPKLMQIYHSLPASYQELLKSTISNAISKTV